MASKADILKVLKQDFEAKKMALEIWKDRTLASIKMKVDKITKAENARLQKVLNKALRKTMRDNGIIPGEDHEFTIVIRSPRLRNDYSRGGGYPYPQVLDMEGYDYWKKHPRETSTLSVDFERVEGLRDYWKERIRVENQASESLKEINETFHNLDRKIRLHGCLPELLELVEKFASISLPE